ncbi:uroporphyrinogen-III C-methyltransferase [Agaribacter flavus]|uniref:Uroporphyrinogen-III C-methyltransferase n=1 Tax=Agaribacter flavus TaxID=1902781 RepID=A0ABV7FU45_9ALTE
MSDTKPENTEAVGSEQTEALEIEAEYTHTPLQAPKSKQAKTGALWFITILNLMMLCGVGAAGYWAWDQYQQSVESKDEKLIALEQGLSRLSSANTRTTEDFQEKNTVFSNNLAALYDELKSTQEINKALQKQLAELSGRRPSDWLLAEANYLVNLAGRKLYLENDHATAIALLNEADARVTDLNDPALFPLRTAIASDIAALEQINPTSLTSIALTLGGMLTQVNSLPLNTFVLPETTEKEDLTLSSDPADWKENLSRTWRAIVGDFISIKHVDAPIEPYLAERQQWLIEQQLKHALSRAQSAVLTEAVVLFEQSIDEAGQLTAEHYSLDSPQVERFLSALQTLRNTDFKKVYPDSLLSQSLLKDITEQRLRLNTAIGDDAE